MIELPLGAICTRTWSQVIEFRKWIYKFSALVICREDLFQECSVEVITLSELELSDVSEDTKLVFVTSNKQTYVWEYDPNNMLIIKKISTVNFTWNMLFNLYLWKQEFRQMEFLWR